MNALEHNQPSDGEAIINATFAFNRFGEMAVMVASGKDGFPEDIEERAARQIGDRLQFIDTGREVIIPAEISLKVTLTHEAELFVLDATGEVKAAQRIKIIKGDV